MDRRASETGVGRAEGTAVNLAYLPAVTDYLWLRCFHAVVPGVLRTFEPQIIVMQAGCDSHREDPLAAEPAVAGSIAWRIHRERVLLAGWGRAILLQLAHPLVACGVAQHSRFTTEPWGRIRRLQRTLSAMRLYPAPVSRMRSRS